MSILLPRSHSHHRSTLLPTRQLMAITTGMTSTTTGVTTAARRRTTTTTKEDVAVTARRNGPRVIRAARPTGTAQVITVPIIAMISSTRWKPLGKYNESLYIFFHVVWLFILPNGICRSCLYISTTTATISSTRRRTPWMTSLSGAVLVSVGMY